MLKDITLGQYFPGNSPVHRLDPRTKLVMLLVYIVALFVSVSWISYGVMFAFLALVIHISKIPVKNILRGMKPLVVIFRNPTSTSTLPSVVKNRFRIPVNTRIITSGFIPLTMDLGGIVEIFTANTRKASMTP